MSHLWLKGEVPETNCTRRYGEATIDILKNSKHFHSGHHKRMGTRLKNTNLCCMVTVWWNSSLTEGWLKFQNSYEDLTTDIMLHSSWSQAALGVELSRLPKPEVFSTDNGLAGPRPNSLISIFVLPLAFYVSIYSYGSTITYFTAQLLLTYYSYLLSKLLSSFLYCI